MKYILYITLLLLLSSCAKDKLFGDKSVLIGTWKWIYSEHEFDFCDGDPNYTITVTPDSEGVIFSIKFYENGTVKFYENNHFLSKHRLVFTSEANICYGELSGYKSFVASLDNKTEDANADFFGCFDGNNLVIKKGFPFDIIKIGCENYTSYFVRE